MTPTFRQCVVLLAAVLVGSYGWMLSAQPGEPKGLLGASVYQERCVLCHGSRGMGEGTLPLSLQGYPAASLVADQRFTTLEQLTEVISSGETGTPDADVMPAWKDVLADTEIDAVAHFVVKLRDEPVAAYRLLDQAKVTPDPRRGELIFSVRCTLCHGEQGRGDGRMARKAEMSNQPLPSDLTSSTVPAEYVRSIVTFGGEVMSRSPMMPPWGQELSRTEMADVVAYVMSLREQPAARQSTK